MPRATPFLAKLSISYICPQYMATRLSFRSFPTFSASSIRHHHHCRTISAVHVATMSSDDDKSDTPSPPPPRPLHHPSLEVTGGARDSFLPIFKTLHHPYNPFPLVAHNRHLETIFSSFFRTTPSVRYKRECLRTQDDGSVALDWVSGDSNRLPSDSPILILLPGLTGGSEDSYVRHLLVKAKRKGWRVVVFNSRGCGDSPVTTPQFYSASFLGDMTEVVAHITRRYPSANLYAVGWSLGANILVNYLGQESDNCPLKGAVSLCNPFNLVIADEDFRKGFNIVYDKTLCKALLKIFRKHAFLFEELGGEFDIPSAANARSVKEFDQALTRVSFGFESADDYYSKSSSSNVIKGVHRPLLCIQAANDPLAPERGIPREDIKDNPNCLLIVTPKGGHLGWAAGPEAPFGAPWTDPVVMDFLEHLEKGASKFSDSGSGSGSSSSYSSGSGSSSSYSSGSGSYAEHAQQSTVTKSMHQLEV